MRMRNGNRFAKEHSGTPSDSSSHELGEIEVLYFNVLDKEKLKELSVRKYSDMQISVTQPNMQQPHDSDKGNSSSNQENMQLIEANSSQTMAKKDGGGTEALDKEKSNSFANNQMEGAFSNATVNLEQAASASSPTGKAIIGQVENFEERASTKRMRSIHLRQKQSKSVGPDARAGRCDEEMTVVGYNLRPRRKGRVIKTKSLDCVRNGDNNLKPTSSKANEDADILITDMLNAEVKIEHMIPIWILGFMLVLYINVVDVLLVSA